MGWPWHDMAMDGCLKMGLLCPNSNLHPENDDNPTSESSLQHWNNPVDSSVRWIFICSEIPNAFFTLQISKVTFIQPERIRTWWTWWPWCLNRLDGGWIGNWLGGAECSTQTFVLISVALATANNLWWTQERPLKWSGVRAHMDKPTCSFQRKSSAHRQASALSVVASSTTQASWVQRTWALQTAEAIC